MKICCIVPSLAYGGMERVMSNLITYFSDVKSAEVHLILYGKKRIIQYPISDKVIVHYPKFKFNDSISAISTIRTMVWMRREVKKMEVDTILSFGEYWNNLVLLSLFKIGIPIFVSDRSKPDLDLGILHNFLRKKLYPNAKGIICQTKKASDIMNDRIIHNNIVVIGNPIKNIFVDDIKKENIVLSVGRLIDTKHFDRLIAIFAKINMPDWKLVIIGGDSIKQNNYEALSQKILQLKMQDKIILAGYSNHVEEYMLKSKIFAFLSSSEGFPNVIGEAMSAGLPIISYDCVAGPSDMVEDNVNGFLINLFDDDNFESKLRYLMNNTELIEKFGKNSKNLIKKYNIEKISELFYNVITQ